MIISRKYEFIFLAMNKCASTSVEHALKKYQNPIAHKLLNFRYDRSGAQYMFKHASATDVRDLVGSKEWERYTCFTFVRNPWDRLVSLYHYHNQRGAEKFPLAQCDFETWLKQGGTGSAGKLMSSFICDGSGASIVDFVGRYENLEEDFEKICSAIGIKSSLPHVNTSNRRDYREYYNEETVELVREMVRPDIEMFNYDF